MELVQVLRRRHEAGRKLIDYLQSPLEAMAPENRADFPGWNPDC
jgi:hypothetical protein